MKNRLIHILASALAFCLLLAAVPAVPAGAVSMQEQSWLKWLAPGLDDPPKNSSFPAQLIVYAPKLELGFNGTCALRGEISDEEKLKILNEACSAVGDYKSPEDACDDQRLADALKLKLSFKPEDQQRIINNWISIIGMDKVAAILGGKFPEYGLGDAISMGSEFVGNIAELAMTPDISNASLSIGSLSPVPLGFSDFAQGFLLNGTLITWDEFWRDKDRWKDQVTLLNTLARLNRYYDKVRLLMDDAERKNLKWKIEINDQIIKSIQYGSVQNVYQPCICYVDIDLKKEGNGGNTPPTGQYTGLFNFRTAMELSDYDANFHKYLAKAINDGVIQGLQAAGAGMAKNIPFVAVSQSVAQHSVNEYTLEDVSFQFDLEVPEGAKGVIVDEKIDVMALDQKKYIQKTDFLSHLVQENEAAKVDLYWAEMEDSETGTYYRNTYGETIIKTTGQVTPFDNPESGTLPKPDVRPYIQMRLIVDLTQMK